MTLVQFKFKPLDANGQEQGFLSKKGEITQTDLVLDGQRIPLVSVARTSRFQNQLSFLFATGGHESTATSIAITKGKAEQLKQGIDVICSMRWAQDHKRELDAQGIGWQFKTAQCPHCKSTVDLSGYESTPQMYCPYCETVVNRGGPSPLNEHEFRLCDVCGYYSQPKTFTTFYFYFAFVVYGFRWRRSVRCNACMRSEAWRMAAFNLPFVVGFPVALVQLYRAYFGRGGRKSAFRLLDTANLAARKGEMHAAIPAYETMLAGVDHAAGLRYNLALANANANLERCAEAARAALADCANYEPAARLGSHALQSLGRGEEAEVFERTWNAAA